MRFSPLTLYIFLLPIFGCFSLQAQSLTGYSAAQHRLDYAMNKVDMWSSQNSVGNEASAYQELTQKRHNENSIPGFILGNNFRRIKPKPDQPLHRRKEIQHQFWGGFAGLIVGAGVGVILGTIIGGTANGHSWSFGNTWPENMGMAYGSIFGAVAGTATGVLLVGNDSQVKGSTGLTILGAVVSGLATTIIGAMTFGLLFLVSMGTLVIGTMYAYNSTRAYRTAPPSDTIGMYQPGHYPMGLANNPSPPTRFKVNLLKLKF